MIGKKSSSMQKNAHIKIKWCKFTKNQKTFGHREIKWWFEMQIIIFFENSVKFGQNKKKVW